jgi:hypothetical protein
MIVPILDGDFSLMYGTSAFFYLKNNKLIKFTFQIIGNKGFAEFILNKFRNYMVTTFGMKESLYININQIIFNEGNEFLALEFPTQKNTSGYIHFFLKND